MAKKVAAVNGKGGVGKTTTMINLACRTHEKGNKSCIVDTDPQGSTRDWRQIQAEESDLPTVVGIDKPTLHKDIPGIEPAFDYIFVDGTSKTNAMNASIIKAVDLILIPIQPSVLDIWGASETIDLIKERQMITDGFPKAAFLISMNKKNTNLSKEIAPALKSVGLPLLKTRISAKEIYKQSLAQGLPAFHIGRQNYRNEVIHEIDNLLSEIDTLINQSELLES